MESFLGFYACDDGQPPTLLSSVSQIDLMLILDALLSPFLSLILSFVSLSRSSCPISSQSGVCPVLQAALLLLIFFFTFVVVLYASIIPTAQCLLCSFSRCSYRASGIRLP